MTTNNPISLTKLLAFEAHPETKPLLSEVISKRHIADRRRAAEDEYLKPVFARYDFRVKEEWRDDKSAASEHRIEKPKDLYLADDADPQLPRFYADCDTAHLAQGFAVPLGYSPASMAENDASNAETALLIHAEKHLGFPATQVYGQFRKDFLDLMRSLPAFKNLATELPKAIDAKWTR